MTNPPGYIIEHQGKREFLFTNDAFLELAGGKAQAQALKAELSKRELIATAGGGDRARTGVLACWGRGKQTTSQRQANRLAWRVWPLLRRRCRALAWGHKGP